MADERRVLNEAESKEYAGYLTKSRERHITFEAGIVPGFATRVLDVDVSLPLWGKTVHAGMYQMRLPEAGTHVSEMGEEHTWLWTLVPDAESLYKAAERVERESGKGEPYDWDDTVETQDEPEPVRFKMNLVRLDIEEGKPLTFFELLAWLAIHDAENEGNTARADRIFTLAYGVKREDVFRGLEKNRPMVLRVGREMTAGMEATTKRGTFENPDGGEFVMTNEIMVSAAKAGGLTISTGIKKTLAWLNHLATESGYGYEAGRNCVISTNVAEIMRVRGLDDTRKHRERVRKDIKALARWSFEFEDKKTHEWVRIPLAGGAVQIRRGGAITFAISADFMRAVLNSRAGLLPMDPALMRTDDKRNPHAWAIGYKLATHTYMNKGEANESTLSVKKLLDHLEDVPRAEEVKGQNYTQKIIAPVERDLTALVELGVLDWWDYCHTKGEPLTDAEQGARFNEDGNDAPLPYEIAIKANIQWQLSHTYEEHMAQVLAARERHSAEAKAAREKAKKKQRRIESRKERRVAEKLAEAEAEKLTRESGENAPSK